MLARKDIDAVCIATQDHWHALIAKAAAKAGKDMYCQKPLGVTDQQCRVIRDAVRRYGRIFQTGTQQRSERGFRFACELARNGYLGKLHTVEVAAPGPSYKRMYRSRPEPVPQGFDFDMFMGPAKRPYNGGLWAWPDWYLIRDYCVGFIVNWGVHHLDIANWGCPTVTSEPCELEFTGSYRDDGLTDNINDWKGEFRYESGLLTWPIAIREIPISRAASSLGTKAGCTSTGTVPRLSRNRYVMSRSSPINSICLPAPWAATTTTSSSVYAVVRIRSLLSRPVTRRAISE